MKYKELKERIASGETGKPLDSQLWNLIDARPLESPYGDRDVHYKRCPEDSIAFDIPPAYTTSIDSAISLVNSYMETNEKCSAVIMLAMSEWEEDGPSPKVSEIPRYILLELLDWVMRRDA